MNQKNLLIAAAMFAALMATAALATTSLVQQAFAQAVDTTTQEGIRDDDDAKQASSTPTKVKNTMPCNISGFRNTCEQEPEAELDASEEED
ncbi:MAG TPA: hypothetical protein VIP70_08815 [Nitrososphaeraceae archaeon]